MTVPSVTALLETHARMERYLVLHQEALLDMDLPMARQFLQEHAALTRRHIGEEEQVLFPVYGARVGELPGGSLEQFRAEHGLIQRTLDELLEKAADLRLDQRDIRRRVIALFDREAMYKHLLDHHDRRERATLYPALDRVTEPGERAELLGGCSTLADGEPAPEPAGGGPACPEVGLF